MSSLLNMRGGFCPTLAKKGGLCQGGVLSGGGYVRSPYYPVAASKYKKREHLLFLMSTIIDDTILAFPMSSLPLIL